MGSCGSPVGAALPEVLKASAEFGATQGDDGVGAIDGPVHASAFEACPDHHFASRLKDAGGGTQSLGVKLWVAHAGAIVKDVHGAFGRLCRGSSMGFESVDDGVQFAIIQFSAARRCPWFAFAGCAEDRLSGAVQSFFGVEPIEDLSGLGKQFPGGVPNPGSAIASTTQRGASVKPRRVASRSTRSAKSDRSGLVSEAAALSIAAE